MSRKEHIELSKIIAQHPWLSDKSKEIRNLLFSECETDEHRHLITALISELVHVDMHSYKELIKSVAENIKNTHLMPSTTLIVSMTGDRSADSGQHVLYELKYFLRYYKWTGYTAVNKYNESHKIFKDNGQQDTDLILVDNFIGSGRTVQTRINWVQETFTTKNYKTPNISVKVALCTKSGFDFLKSQGVDVYASKIINDKLIENLFSSNKDHYIEMMQYLESKLLTVYKTKKNITKLLPSLGYGKAQVALSIETMNTPNNVFPIFWWQYANNAEEREVLLLRDMEDA